MANKNYAETSGKDLLAVLRKAEPRFYVILISSLLWGLVCHGSALFNKFSMHDDIHELFDIGATYASGRWFLGILGGISQWFFGSSSISLPLVNGLFCILCMALSVYLIAIMLDIRGSAACIAATGLFVSFPALAGTFGYMFTAPYYLFAFLLSAFGVYLVHLRKVYSFLAGIILTACAIGVYQAYIPITLGIYLLLFLQEAAVGECWSWKNLLREIALYAGAVLGFMAIYFVVNKLFINWMQITLNDYQGISNMGQEGLTVYLRRVFHAYRVFLQPRNLALVRFDAVMYPMRVLTLYQIAMAASGLLSLRLVISLWKRSRINALSLLLGMGLLPLATHFIYVMCHQGAVYHLMTYGAVLPFVFLLWLLCRMPLPSEKMQSLVYTAGISLLILAAGMYCRYDNACYLKAQLQQQQAISYYTVLIQQIKSAEGYRDEYPVAYINERELQDSTLTQLPELDEVTVIAQDHLERMLISYSWKVFMARWCGFDPAVADPAEFESLPEVEAMPHYPDQGSICVMDGTVIVKF